MKGGGVRYQRVSFRLNLSCVSFCSYFSRWHKQHVEDIHLLKSKVASFKRRYEQEKEDRCRAEKGKKSSTRKIILLSNHIEKLMDHIKHEAVAKARAQARKRVAARELKLLR